MRVEVTWLAVRGVDEVRRPLQTASSKEAVAVLSTTWPPPRLTDTTFCSMPLGVWVVTPLTITSPTSTFCRTAVSASKVSLR